jgi:hypothetical protein
MILRGSERREASGSHRPDFPLNQQSFARTLVFLPSSSALHFNLLLRADSLP